MNSYECGDGTNLVRMLVIETPSKNNPRYIKNIKKYKEYEQEFEKRCIKIKVNRNEKFKINLIGFDGEIKASFDELYPKAIFELIKFMPMGDYRKNMSGGNNKSYEKYLKNKKHYIKLSTLL